MNKNGWKKWTRRRFKCPHSKLNCGLWMGGYKPDCNIHLMSGLFLSLGSRIFQILSYWPFFNKTRTWLLQYWRQHFLDKKRKVTLFLWAGFLVPPLGRGVIKVTTGTRQWWLWVLLSSVSHPPTLLRQKPSTGTTGLWHPSHCSNARVAFWTFERGSSTTYHSEAEFSRFLLLSFSPQNTQRERFARTTESLKVNIRL